ncbi:MAG: alpha-E domain-containing protein [Verrucomicrobia bacterium]|nr:alpha-E domain-containing protein [Verrucomicrobiota bacterium]
MLSRVADSLYWMARHIERAENLARLMEVINLSGLDLALSTDQQVRHYWMPVLEATACDELFAETQDEDSSAADILEFMNFSKANPDSIRNCIATARENARMVRDKLSVEMWLELNGTAHLSGFLSNIGARPASGSFLAIVHANAGFKV